MTPTHVRLPEPVDRELSAYVQRTGLTKSRVMSRAVDEWLRGQNHPRIRFVTEITGERRAALAAGPQVWTVAEAWLAHGGDERNPATVAHSTGLAVADVEAALSYWAQFRDEIDQLLARQRQAQDEALAAWERREALNAIPFS
jgi:Arc/MetJ-type ribon-helix-helix transcriptional regulator